MSLQLQSIELNELQNYQKLYKQNWPKYCAEYYCLDNFIGFLENEPNIANLHIYTLNTESAQNNALFVIVDRYQLFVGCLSNSQAQLTEALTLLDWSAGLKCSSIPKRHINELRSVINAKQLKIIFDDPTNLYYMPAEQAARLQVDIPAGFYMKTLNIEDAALINDEWPNRHLGSLYFVQRQIRLCVNVGLYDEQSNELIAWCIRLQGGFLGALQVLATHKRRGFGSLVTKEISRRIAALGQDVMALVNPQNSSSCGMFDKLGFQIIDQAYWLRTEPTVGEFKWPEGE